MTTVRARNADPDIPVDGGSGRSTFDGNATNRCTGWFQRPDKNGLPQDDLDLLMISTVRGHLAWFCYPCKEY